MKKIYLFIIVLFAAASVNAQNSPSLPDLVIKDANGNNKNIRDYATNGKTTIISFWATWCSPCIKELRNVNELLEDWVTEYNLELVAVSIDNAKNSLKVKPFVDGQGWTFDVLLDVNEDLKRALNVTNPPVTFLLDESGKIVYTHTGYVEGDEFELEKELKKLKMAKTTK